MSLDDSVVLLGVAAGLVALAFGLCAGLCSLVRRYAPAWGFVDRPGGHKGHKKPTPLGGGVAIWLTTVIILGLCLLAALAARSVGLPEPLARYLGGIVYRSGELIWILALASVIMAMGLCDDIYTLNWRLRLGIQLTCATLVAWSGIRVTLFGPFTHPLMGGTVTVLWIVGLTNAFNMLDNMDGLSASVGLIAASLFCGAQLAVGSLFAPAVLLVLVGALAGFLVHNHTPARLFMGDSGSNFLGFLLGALTVVGTFTRDERGGSYSPYGVLAPLLVMAVPLYDMISVIFIRLREGRSPFMGDRRHFSHRLVARGLTASQAVLTIDLVTLAGGLGALLLHRLDGLGAGVVMAQTCCLLGVVAILELSASRSEHTNGQTRRKSSVPPRPRPAERPASQRRSADQNGEDHGGEAAQLGEHIRRLALGLTVALVTARAFWPSEPELIKGAGRGLSWVLAVFVVCGLALAAGLIGGRFRFRWSWTDALVIGLMTLVARSQWHAVDRRPAINMAWEWIALGLAYLLVRNLPRTRNESSTLAGVLVATAFAVSCYGLYQNGVELPMLQAAFQRNPQQFLRALDIEPGSRGEAMLRNRLLFSNELFSTFALPNSLAGFIVGPLALALAVSLQSLVRRDTPGSRWSALAMAAPVMLVLLVSLILTKSRSAWVGLLVAMIYWAWHARRHLSVRVLVASGIGGLALVAALVLAGLATGRLDREVVTQSTMSLRYRWEYWQGAWGVISGGATNLMSILKSPIFWWGVGPGNFGGHYLKYKLPEASEEIQDPHNLFLEVWSTAGAWAVVALIGALGWGLWNIFGRSARDDENDGASRTDRGRRRDSRRESAVDLATGTGKDLDLDSVPNRTTWLVGCAGVGGWALVALLGELNPFEAQMAERWLILGMSWPVGVILGAPLWRRLPISAAALGAGVVAVVINLLAAGGIGYPTVALGLWLFMALGLNLRDDRSCGRLRHYESRVPPFVLAVVWAAVLGTFAGTIAPFWRSEAAIARAQAAASHRPPDVELADEEYEFAIAADRYFARPWRELANLHLQVWQERGAAVDDRDTRWSMKTIPFLYQMVVTPPRNPDSWTMHDERARVIHQMLKITGSKLQPLELMKLRGEMIKSTRLASLLYPTKIELHARLAEASAEIGMYQDAVDEAREALRLDRITPHRDKKLPEAIRNRLEAEIPTWSENAAKNPIERTR